MGGGLESLPYLQEMRGPRWQEGGTQGLAHESELADSAADTRRSTFEHFCLFC